MDQHKQLRVCKHENPKAYKRCKYTTHLHMTFQVRDAHVWGVMIENKRKKEEDRSKNQDVSDSALCLKLEFKPSEWFI